MTRWLCNLSFVSIFMIVTALGLYAVPSPSLAAAPVTQIHGPFVGPVVHGASFDGDVRSLTATLPTARDATEARLPVLRAPRPAATPGARATAGTAQAPRLGPPARPSSPSAVPLIAANFSGIHQTSFPSFNAWPPDPTGDVGFNYYVQAVNRSIGIYDKAGTPLATFAYHSIFTGTGTLCDTNQRDDPAVVYDSFADRWMFTFFAFVDLSHPFYQCFAVSKTSDPVAGGWWLFGLLADPEWLDDYPKFSLWPDAYYMTANMFRLGDSYQGVRVWALDRASMLNGTLNSVSFDIPWDGYCCFSMLPATVRGTAPPAGSPDYFLDAETSVPGQRLHLWKFHVDWSMPMSSTFTGPVTLTVNTFDSPSSGIPQLGSPETVDAGDDNLMTPLQYRRINGVESLWASQTIGRNSSNAIRWYEIRNPFSSTVVYQQGTFQPDTNFRWMPSLSVDAQGNMAMGYSVSGATMFPAIRVTGRLATDPLGFTGSQEGSMIEGTGSQLGGYKRWGDYSAMSVDPADDCTFWYTNMYYQTTSSDWQTRIGTVTFPSCPRPTAVGLNRLSAHSIGKDAQTAWPPVALALAGLAAFWAGLRRKKR